MKNILYHFINVFDNRKFAQSQSLMNENQTKNEHSTFVGKTISISA